MPGPKRAMLTLSIAHTRRHALAGAFAVLRRHNRFANISTLVIGLVLEADCQQRVVSTLPQVSLVLLEGVIT